MSTEDEKKRHDGTANLKPYGSEGAPPRSQEIEGANKPWSIRNSLRYLARQEIDRDDPASFKNLLPKKCTVAQLVAANALAKASKGDMRAVDYATDQIDGKLAQTNLNADFAALQSMSEEQLYDIIDRFNAQREAEPGTGVGSGTGDPEADPSKTPA